jgi:hypothetical protein
MTFTEKKIAEFRDKFYEIEHMRQNMTFTEKKIAEFRDKFYEIEHIKEGGKPEYQIKAVIADFETHKIDNWIRKTIPEAERRNLKSVIEKCDEIDKRIFNAQDSAWKDRGLYCDEAKIASNALDEVAEFCQQKIKELERE